MKALAVTILATCLATVAVEAASSASYNITPASMDLGGGQVASAKYAVDAASVGGISGLSSSASYAARQGYAGQVFEVSTLTANTVSTNLNENTSVALSPYAILTDGTRLSPAVLQWFTSGAIASVSPAGVVTAPVVYTNLAGAAWGGLGTKTISRSFWVLDTNPDNYGIYGGDGIPDWWQVLYFGTNNPAGLAAADPTGTHQNNLFRYIAGLNPTNPASVFALNLAAVPGQARQKQVSFGPRYTNRTYTVEYANTLGSAFSNLVLATTGDNGTTRTVTDTNATTASRLYRVLIRYP